MCLEDAWIGLHSVHRVLGTGFNTTAPYNPSRIGFAITQSNQVTITTKGGTVWFKEFVGTTPSGFNTSVSTQVPPGTDTGTITTSSTIIPYKTYYLWLKDYGQIIQEENVIAYGSTTGTVSEIVMDAELQNILAAFDAKRMAEFIATNPQVKGNSNGFPLQPGSAG